MRTWLGLGLGILLLAAIQCTKPRPGETPTEPPTYGIPSFGTCSGTATLSLGMYNILSYPGDFDRLLEDYVEEAREAIVFYAKGVRVLLNAWWPDEPHPSHWVWGNGTYEAGRLNPEYFRRIRRLCQYFPEKPVFSVFHVYQDSSYDPLINNSEGVRVRVMAGRVEGSEDFLRLYVRTFFEGLREACPHAWIEPMNEPAATEAQVWLHRLVIEEAKKAGFTHFQVNATAQDLNFWRGAFPEAQVFAIHGLVPRAVSESNQGYVEDLPVAPDIELSDDGQCCGFCIIRGTGERVGGCRHVVSADLVRYGLRLGFKYFEIDWADPVFGGVADFAKASLGEYLKTVRDICWGNS